MPCPSTRQNLTGHSLDHTPGMNMAAVARGVDPNNKTASIRARHSRRLTSVPLDEFFTQDQEDTSRSASNQARPVVEGVPQGIRPAQLSSRHRTIA